MNLHLWLIHQTKMLFFQIYAGHDTILLPQYSIPTPPGWVTCRHWSQIHTQLVMETVGRYSDFQLTLIYFSCSHKCKISLFLSQRQMQYTASCLTFWNQIVYTSRCKSTQRKTLLLKACSITALRQNWDSLVQVQVFLLYVFKTWWKYCYTYK